MSELDDIRNRSRIVDAPTGHITWVDVDRWRERLALAARQIERDSGDGLVIMRHSDFLKLIELASPQRDT